MLKEYLYEMINMANEEANDGDAESGNGLTDCISHFTAVLKGDEKQSDYHSLSGVDLSGISEKWRGLTDKERHEEVNELVRIVTDFNKKEVILKAWRRGDRNGVMAAVNG